MRSLAVANARLKSTNASSATTTSSNSALSSVMDSIQSLNNVLSTSGGSKSSGISAGFSSSTDGSPVASAESLLPKIP